MNRDITFDIDFFCDITCRSKRDLERKIAPVAQIIKAFRGGQRIYKYDFKEAQTVFNFFGEMPNNEHNRQVLKKYPNLFRIKEE